MMSLTSRKVLWTAACAVVVCGSAYAASLTAKEIQQIESDLGITLSASDQTDLAAIVKPDGPLPAWRTDAYSRIDTHRKADLDIQIVDQYGDPVEGAEVKVRLKKNHFKFGGVVTVMDLTDADGKLAAEGSTPGDWERITTNLFNAVGLNNGFKPKITSQHQYIPGFMSWASANNMDVRGHLLIWPGGGNTNDLSGTPGDDFGNHLSTASTSAYASYNILGAVNDWINAANPSQKIARKADLKDDVDAEIAQWASQWNVYEWDVINETIGNTLLQEILGFDQMAEWFKIAETNKVDADTGLYINEFQIISADHTDDGTKYSNRRNTYMNRIDTVIADGGPITGIGFQSRYKYGHIDPATVYSRLDDFATNYPGFTFAGTEFEIKDGRVIGEVTNVYDELTRAQMTEEIMTTYFSHDQVIGLNAWDAIDPSSDPDPAEITAALAWYDGTVKLNGLVWYYLHRIRYNTDAILASGLNGRTGLRAFKGDYDITVRYKGQEYGATVVHTNDQAIVLTLNSTTADGSVPAQVMDAWNYEGLTNGAGLAEGVSTGLVGGVSINDNKGLSSIQNETVCWQSDGVADSLYQNVIPSSSAGATDGVFQLSMDYLDADFSASAAVSNGSGRVAIGARTDSNVDVNFRLVFNSGGGSAPEYQLQLSDDLGNNQTIATFPGTTLGHLNVRALYDFGNRGSAGSYQLYYRLDGGSEVAAYMSGQLPIGFALDKLRLTVQTYNGGVNWAAGDQVYTDNLVLRSLDELPAPVFTVDPINKPDADADSAYSGQSISGTAINALSYAIVAGPAWLSIAPNGDLSGTPGSDDAGQNSWIVQASNGIDTETAVLEITVTGSGVGAPPKTVAVSEDQFIHAGQPTTVQSLDNRLDIRNSDNASFARVPYLKFNTGTLTGTVDSVTLNVYTEDELNVVNALAVADSSWQATTLTWANAPTRGAVIGSGQAASANSWFSIDVTSHITGSGIFSIALDEQADGAREFIASSRSANGASLYITFSGPGNAPPVFTANPIQEAAALQNSPYTGSSLADNATDGDSDPMTFMKMDGPSWLGVATNGVLSGTPLFGDLGTNNWQVSVTDGTATNFANLQIIVNGPATPPVSPYEGTNILFIAIDDMKPLLGCYGDTFAISPRIDTLASAGVAFQNAQCQWAVCGPSRASLMTGLYPEETGVMGFKTMRGNANAIRPNLVTMQQWLRYNGYRTAATGKINDPRCVGSMDAGTGVITPDNTIAAELRVDDPPSWGDPVDTNYLPSDFFTDSSYMPYTGGWSPAGNPSTGATNLPDSAFVDGIICDQGITLLNNLATNDAQFFLGVGFKKPHLPFVAPQQYWDMYDRNDIEIAPFQDHPENEVPYSWKYATELAAYDEFYDSSPGSTDPAVGIPCTNIPAAKQKELIHGYYACTSFIDAQIGRLLDELETLGLHTNTIVVIWGDHGFHLGDHAEWAKHTNLEQASRSPLIIYSPFTGSAGTKPTAPVNFVDIYPTLCELAGLPVPEQPLAENEDPFDPASGRRIKGENLVPMMNDPSVSVRTGAMTLFSRDGAMGYAYRTERYRYIEWIDGGIVAQELYDYDLDPLETINLAYEPGFDGLMYQFSRAMREEMNALALSGGDIACPELQGSPAVALPANTYLPYISGTISASDFELAWPDAAYSTYNVLEKTNLLDATWSISQADVSGSPQSITITNDAAFYRIEVSN